MIAVNAALSYYLDQVECLRAVERAARAGTFASPRFENQTLQQVQVRLGELRNELDREVVLVLVASAEGTLRRDLAARIQPSGSMVGWKVRGRQLAFRLHLPKSLWEKVGTLEDRLTNLRTRHGNRMPLEELLGVWKNAGANKNVVGQFKQLLKHRHWLAHGRYYQDPSGLTTPPDPMSAYNVIDAMFQELKGLRQNFPLP